MGAPRNPTERDVVEAIELAKEAIDAVAADEESWFDRLVNNAARGANGTDQTIQETYVATLFTLMLEVVKSRPLVLAARAESRINENASVALNNAVSDYENHEF